MFSKRVLFSSHISFVSPIDICVTRISVITPKSTQQEVKAEANSDELNQVEQSTDEAAKQEDRAAEQADAASDEAPKNKPEDEKINTDGQDEAQLPAEEFQDGVNEAEK